VPVLMCTQKLWRRVEPGRPLLAGAPRGAGRPAADRSVLGNWSANLVTWAHEELVLFLNQKTLLAVVARPGPIEELALGLRIGLGAALVRLGVPDDRTEAEQAALADLALGRNDDRRLLGFLNDVASEGRHLARCMRGRAGGLDLGLLGVELNEMPHPAFDPPFARDAVRAAFGVA
jgi:hypothetical protein